MKLKEFICSLYIWTSEQGEVFYPYGRWGKGYILDVEGRAQIRRFINKYLVPFYLMLPFFVLVFRIYAIFLLPIALPVYHHKIKKLLVGQREIAKSSLTFEEILQSTAKSFHLLGVIVMLLLCFLMIGVSLVYILFAKGSMLIGILCCLLAVGGFVLFLLTLIKRVNPHL